VTAPGGADTARFWVWAPRARSVEIVFDDARHALVPADGGCWEVDLPGPRALCAYRFSVDGGEPLPDPRSRWQGGGVHGPSGGPQTGSHRQHGVGLAATGGAFRPKPLREAVIYELHIGTFTPQGTYAAAGERLAYLADLGVTHVEIMPLATFPGRHGWGYDGVDWYAPHPAYGTPADLAALVDACHRHGLGVLLDVVYNHLGPDGNYLARFGPYFTDRVKTPWGESLNFDGADSDEVRRFVIDNACMWLADYGFDGLRLDAVHAILSFEAVHLLEDLAGAVKALSVRLQRPLLLIAESDLNDPRLVLPAEFGGFGLDAHWADDFHHSLHRLFTGETGGYYADFDGLPDLAKALAEGYVYQGQHSAFRRRRHGRAPRHVEPHQLVVFAQNHDQIGNRAFGERLSMLLTPAQLKAVAALTLLSPFVPLLFQGEEWGASTPFLYFTDHADPELGRLVAEGRRGEFAAFGWADEIPNPQAAETFARSKLQWSELAQPRHAELLDWHRRLIAIRRGRIAQDTATPRGEGSPRAAAQIAFDAAAGWLTHADRTVLAVYNLAAHPQRVPLPPGRWRLELCSEPAGTDWSHEVAAGATGIFVQDPP
jgi:maltooligosyltrehalose trehalohydrolase